MKRIVVLALTVCAFVCSCSKGPEKYTLCRVDPLYKVVPGDTSYCEVFDTICVARGENAVVQLVMSNISSDTLSNPVAAVKFKGGAAKTGWVHNVRCYNRPWGADDLLESPDSTYPDPIIDDAEEILAPGGKGTLWIDIAVPRDAKPGLHKGKVTVLANGQKAVKPFVVKVYPVTLPERQSLTVVQWYHEKSLMWMNGGEPVERCSEQYYEYLQTVAETAAEYGQNCWLIMTLPELVANADNSDFDLDFTEFDRTVEMLVAHGGLRLINSGHFGSRLPDSAWSDEFVFKGYEWKDGKAEQFSCTADDPRLEAYISRYFPILVKHLCEKGWLDMYCQHIADEPDVAGTPNHESWIKVARMVKDAAPGIRIIDASFDILEGQDITVPILGESIARYSGAPEGGERWLYTCTTPQGNFANRFIHQPLLKPRLIHWLNYKYGTTGYLHWGLNWWEGCDDPMHDVTPHTNWPCGDCYIIYPGEGKVYPSIRLCAMRDGIRDFELLKMAEAKDPSKAAAICDAVVSGPDSYVSDIAAFRSIRRSLLEFLSE